MFIACEKNLLERVLERGERIELLVDKTDNLNQQAFAFKKRSTALKVKKKKKSATCPWICLTSYYSLSFA